ncbi:hypothetical protein ACIL2M_004390, partial [Vibrio vulnificus]|nr:hypothetical protein [Vibrio vulnificus]
IKELIMLNQFEWHDLPLEVISIDQFGVSVIVTPYDNENQKYRRFQLQLFNYECLSLSLGGEITFGALKELEISDFTYSVEEGLLSGEIGILPSNEGGWSIKFKKAKWQLVEYT